MRRIAMVGAGQASLLLGCDLLRRGYDVTIYTDRSAEQVRTQPVAAPRFMYMRAVDYERELELNFWDDEDCWFESMRVDFIIGPGKPVTIESAVDGQTIDQRRKYSRWMVEFEQRGGKLQVGAVEVADLEELAQRFDLVMIAAGKGAVFSELFERDDERSLYSEPPRKHIVLSVRNLHQSPRSVIMSFTDADGEIFRVPFTNDAGEQCYNVLLEARPGKRLDRFDGIDDPAELAPLAKELILQFAPWEAQRIRDFELLAPDAWTRFAVQPIVRKPVGQLPSGQAVLGIGDAVLVIDPVAGQGANLASRMAKFLAERIAERGDQPFDAEWMQPQFDEFWESDARFVFAQTKTILTPTKPYKETMLAATLAPAIAHDFFRSLNEAAVLWPWIDEMKPVKEYITRVSGRKWWKITARAKANVVRDQVVARLPGGPRPAEEVAAIR